MVGQLGGVRGGAVDEAGLAAAQERHADQVQTRRGRDTAVVDDPALAVEHRDVQPGQLRPVAGGPDDRRDPARPAGRAPAERAREPRSARTAAAADRRRFRRGRPTRRWCPAACPASGRPARTRWAATRRTARCRPGSRPAGRPAAPRAWPARSGRAWPAPGCRPAASTAGCAPAAGRGPRRSARRACPTASIHHRMSRPR